jgi:hypothetical protein
MASQEGTTSVASLLSELLARGLQPRAFGAVGVGVLFENSIVCLVVFVCCCFFAMLWFSSFVGCGVVFCQIFLVALVRFF